MEVLCVIFGCVAANHLGLVTTIERIVGRAIPIVNCPKCLTFWVSLAVSLPHGLISAIAIAFAASYAAIWLELAMGMLDNLYMYMYETFCRQDDTGHKVAADSADSLAKGGGSALPTMRQTKKPKNH